MGFETTGTPWLSCLWLTFWTQIRFLKSIHFNFKTLKQLFFSVLEQFPICQVANGLVLFKTVFFLFQITKVIHIHWWKYDKYRRAQRKTIVHNLAMLFMKMLLIWGVYFQPNTHTQTHTFTHIQTCKHPHSGIYNNRIVLDIPAL